MSSKLKPQEAIAKATQAAYDVAKKEIEVIQKSGAYHANFRTLARAFFQLQKLCKMLGVDIQEDLPQKTSRPPRDIFKLGQATPKPTKKNTVNNSVFDAGQEVGQTKVIKNEPKETFEKVKEVVKKPTRRRKKATKAKVVLADNLND